MSLHKVTNILIGDGTASPAAGSQVTTANIASGDIAVIKNNMLTAGAALTIADTEKIYIGQGTADTATPIKLSMPIVGRGIKSFTAASYTPATREVWAIGVNRSNTNAGTITAANSTEYKYSVTLKADRNLYAERNKRFSFSFVTDASATQSEIADTIVSQINAQGGLKDLVTAVKVADGTGAYGLTGATDYGVEVWSKTQTQFNTSYFEDRVSFSVHVDDATGFGSATTCAQIQAMTYGSGTYRQVYNMENFAYQYEGVVNRTKWPIPTLTYSSSSSTFTSSNISGVTGNVTTVSGEDVLTVVTSTAALRAGELIDVDGVNYEIKYIMSSTKAVLTEAASASYGAAANLKVKYAYDLINIEFSNPHSSDGANVVMDSQQQVVLAIPAIDSAAAYNSQSTQLIDMLAVLNSYAGSLGFAAVNP